MIDVEPPDDDSNELFGNLFTIKGDLGQPCYVTRDEMLEFITAVRDGTFDYILENSP